MCVITDYILMRLAPGGRRSIVHCGITSTRESLDSEFKIQLGYAHFSVFRVTKDLLKIVTAPIRFSSLG